MEAGYRQHIPCRKPNLSVKNIEARYNFAVKLKNKPIAGSWDGWIWTDEMYLIVGAHYGPERVIRNGNEKWDDECVDRERPAQVQIMFWGAIIYNVACKDCPYFIWEKGAEAEKEAAATILSFQPASVEKAASQFRKAEAERRKTLPKGQRPRGRPPNPANHKKQLTRVKN